MCQLRDAPPVIYLNTPVSTRTLSLIINCSAPLPFLHSTARPSLLNTSTGGYTPLYIPKHTPCSTRTLSTIINCSPTWRIRGKRKKILVLYSDLACFVNTATLDMYVFMSYTGYIRRNTLFIFLRVRHRDTSIRIPHVGL